ncbi:methyltransferase domain-containing protein [Actinoplanes sp. NPDC051861]|uniref:methyltransferase domain-containing protein n=1 Tax=Actinoplanes sp. NPDC051861 TaxID=3155170 RepID=UPI00342D4935
MTPDWLDFWSGEQRIYVNDRHRRLHFRDTAEQIIKVAPGPGAHVLDYGPGDALEAERIAAECGRLTLCESATGFREALAARFAGHDRITVIGPDSLGAIPDGSVDLIVVNSVVQYLRRDELDRLLATARRLLSARGRLLVGDVIPQRSGLVADSLAMLRFAARERFLGAAVRSMAATVFSPYTRARRELGLTRYDPAEMVGVLAAAGFTAREHRPNLSHNPNRATFVAT